MIARRLREEVRSELMARYDLAHRCHVVWGREGRDTSAAMRLPKEIELKDAPWALNRVL